MLAHVTPLITTTPDVAAVSIAILLSGVGALTIATLLADRGGLLPKSTVAFGRWTATVAMALSMGAAAIHFAVIGEHFTEYAPYGIAFTALAWFQVGWAVSWVMARRRPVALAAIAINGGALAVWAVSRTVGLPIGPEPGELEPVGPLDQLAGVLEAVLIAVLAWDLGIPRIRFRPALPAAGATLVVGSVALAVILATSVAFAASGTDVHQHGTTVEEVVEPDPAPSAIGSLAADPADAEPSPPAVMSLAPSAGPSASSDGAAVPEPSVTESVAPPVTAPRSTPGSTRPPGPTPKPTTRPAPPIPTAAPDRHPGVIEFGSALDAGGQIEVSQHRFRDGETAVWIADLRDAPGVPEILKIIVQVLPDGREFEHWREQVPLSEPTGTRLIGRAELSLYAHGGVGSYRLRYLRGDDLLAEGTFELVP